MLTQPAPVVRLSDAQESPYKYMVWVHYRNYLAHFKAQEELFRELHAALRDADVRPAAPYQEIKIERARPVNPVAPDIKQTLRSFELFSGLNDESIEQIAAGSYYSLIEAGAELVTEGSEVSAVQIVVNGFAQWCGHPAERPHHRGRAAFTGRKRWLGGARVRREGPHDGDRRG